ncbi:PEP-CTERM sorting domain-containing protein [Colwellia sp. BRX10-3]|uniref:PEP-CTERM sorting domain-containing protein n=1 Tax=Colwellia sp. BRX10-3 TaxID=2759844 RepID=UPI0015F3F8E7|nr:PEP-CTERM sorting domain-containing protein [Colwellia sp. BRX10-3]MBA6390697.1 PEP-CTERM sorting domain-containing protein [Colwellia sp. BRX10-3]
MNINKRITAYIKVLFTSCCLLLALPSFASVTPTDILMSHFFAGDNDCNNEYFQDPGVSSFDTCKVAIGEFGVDKVYLANVIAKFDTNNNSNSPTFTASTNYNAQQSQWTFDGDNGLSEEDKNSNWSYTGGSPGIRFWTAKAAGGGNSGGGFNLFWLVDNTIEATNACSPSTFTLACLNLAKTVTSGSWSTPNDKGLSHLTFFGGLIEVCQQNCPPVTVPEPQTIMLLALAMLGLVARKRSTVKNS